MRVRTALFVAAAASVLASPAGVRAQEEQDEEKEAVEESEPESNKRPNPSPYADVRADDWFTLSGPAVNIDGYFRVRSELFHNLSLSRLDGQIDPLVQAGSPPLWPLPPDANYTDTLGNTRRVELCGSSTEPEVCDSEVQAGANLRLRLEPSFHISDNVHVWSQIDALDNIVLGSMPQGFANRPGPDGGYGLVARGGYAPLGAFASTQWAPQSGVNSTEDAIMVKRLWGSYRSPIGKLSFGRMPHHWGMGMLYNAGDGIDSDWQSTVDRITFTYAFEALELYLTGAWDFANEGVSSNVLHGEQGSINSGSFSTEGQAYDIASRDDLDQWVFTVVRRTEPQIARHRLAKGQPVINAGAYFAYQTQTLAQDSADADEGAALGAAPSDISDGLVRRGYEAVIGDVWAQLLYDTFRFEIEAAWQYGTVENTLRDSDSDYDNLVEVSEDGWTISRFGIATEAEWRTLDDRLRLNFNFGFATGDSDTAALQPAQSSSSGSALERQLTFDRTYSTFRFHPDYRVDLILFRNILTRIQGAYYFKPSIEYDFLRVPAGHRAGGGLGVIWSRATEPVQAPGNEPDLGLELNLKLFYQLSEGVISHDVREMGGFYTAVEYGVLFPLPGLYYLPGQTQSYAAQFPDSEPLDVDPAQLARWYLGVMF